MVLALASLIVAQIGTRAHINHTYTALVLLIPLVVGQPRRLFAWLLMVAIQFYAHLSTYQLGRSGLLPQIPLDPTPPQSLITGIQAALAAQPQDRLLSLQGRLNDILAGALPYQEPVLALLSLVHALGAVYLLYDLLRHPSGALQRADGHPA
jgi:hypothetical protein